MSNLIERTREMEEKTLRVIYKTKDYLNYEDTSIQVSLIPPKVTLFIGTNETEKLGELVKKLTENLRKRTWLRENEELELTELDKEIINYENETDSRIYAKIYPYIKYIFEHKDNPEEIEKLEKELNKRMEELECQTYIN